MESFKELLEAELTKAVTAQDPQSIHNLSVLLSDTIVERREVDSFTERISSELQFLGEKMDRGFSGMDKRFETMDKRFEDLINQMNQRFGQQREESNERFEQMDQRFTEQREESDKRFEQVDKRIEQMDRHFNRSFRVISIGIAALLLLLSYGTFLAG
ncbi:MAG: hypothetical protein K9L68_07260 [Spirochaetales bacterium]|nr:hypothetical protein [Spirochaetales bacterium]MCF7938382.1 hypothetical protein [Spirochaetales bacterium]